MMAMTSKDAMAPPAALPSSTKPEATPAPAPVPSNDRGIRIPVIRPQDISIKILHEPQNVDDVELDIVAVHGIGVNPTETWIHRGSKKNWLSDEKMLPAKLSGARIMAFGYDSVWFGENAVKQSVNDVAVKLLNEMEKRREKCPQRPLIYIGHCFGGLVIQKAYTKAYLQQSDWPHLSQSVAGIVFLGTPHHGIQGESGLSTQGEIYSAIIEANLHVEDNALHSMAHDNDVLKEVVNSFTRKIATVDTKPEVYCFYERKATKIGLIIGKKSRPEFVVNETSGALTGYRSEGLPLDHFSLNKFEDPEDNNYDCVSTQIIKMARRVIQEPHDASRSPNPERRHALPTLGAPIAREDNFAHRDGILGKIKKLSSKRPIVALHGPSGTGKTHIAVEYAHVYYQNNPGAKVFWVNANSLEELKLSYGRIAESFHLYLQKATGEELIRAVREHLKKQSYLMILDGLDSEDSFSSLKLFDHTKPLADLLRISSNSNVLVTTRSKAVAWKLVKQEPKYLVEIGSLSVEDASQILLGKVTRDSGRMKSVQEISQQLKGLAGGLTLAASYINLPGKEVSRKVYLEKLLQAKSTEQSAIQQTWEFLHDALKQKHPRTVDLMLFMSSVDVQSLPSILFERSQVQNDIPVLEEWGFVEPSRDRQHFTIAAIFRQCAKDWHKKDAQQATYIGDLTIEAILKRFVDEDGEALLPCALAALKLQQSSAHNRSLMLLRVGQFYAEEKEPVKALKLLNQCLETTERCPDSDEKRVLLEEVKKTIEKAKLLQPGPVTALIPRIKEPSGEEKFAMDAVATASRQFDQALRLESEGQHVEAEKLYFLAFNTLQARMTYRDSQDPEKSTLSFLLKVLSSLACMYGRYGRLREAEDISNSVLSEQRKLLDESDPATLITRHNRALLVQERDADAASRELRQVHKLQMGVLGPQDSATLKTESNIALGYRLMNRQDDARKRFLKVLKMQQTVLGKTHPDTLATEAMLTELMEEVEMGKARPELVQVN